MTTKLALRELCGYRAGDKGDTADVAVFAYHDEVYALLVAQVTAEKVRALFGSMVRGEVLRYEAPNVLALNFVLRGALGGGGPKSLRSDNLGKTLGGALMRLEIEVPDELASLRRSRPEVTWADTILDTLPRT
jgi:hypothetical protein